MSIVGLVLISLLLVLIFESATIQSPINPGGGSPPSGPPPLTGEIVVGLFSNQNESDPLSNPTNGQFPIQDWPVIVAEVTTATPTPSTPIINGFANTNLTGYGQTYLPAGKYVVKLSIETLDVRIPVQILVGNETILRVDVQGSAYQLLYSEETSVVPTSVGVQASMYAELGVSSPVTTPDEAVLLKAHEGSSAGVYRLNATVVSQEPPTGGKQWLELGTLSTFNPVNVTSVYLTTWSYSSFTTIQPVTEQGGVIRVPVSGFGNA